MAEEYIPFCKPCIGNEELDEIVACLKSGWLTTGSRAKQFEEDFSNYIGKSHAVALNSCTAALHLALEAVGLKENELVLVPTMTFAATAEVVRYFNAIPVFVDCHEDDFCMDVDHVEQILEKLNHNQPVKGVPENHGKVKAVIPVHFAGQIADVLKCRELCDKYGLFLIEDCAHCCPAWYQDDQQQWQMVGNTADIACFSFYANKTITTGEGGMAATNNPRWAERIRVMSLHGISKDAWKRFEKSGSWYYEVIAPGYKYNIPDIAASLGIHQLKKADQFLQERQRVTEKYRERLAGCPGIILPIEHENRKHAWHLFIIRIEADTTGIHRNEFIEQMKAKNIGTSVHYIPLHLHKYYKEKFGFIAQDFPVADKIFEQIVSLPLYPDLTNEQVDHICNKVLSILSP